MPRRRTPRPLALALAGACVAASLAGPAVAADPPDLPLPTEETTEKRRTDRSFKVGTFNILGSQHTSGGDRRRTARTAELIRQQNLKLVGLQEVQQDQYSWLREELPRYRIWPGMEYGAQGIRLQIAWRTSRFELLDQGTITTTFSYQERPIPWVRLRDEATGRRLFLIDIHNSPLDQEADRDSATRKEIRLYRELRDRGGSVLIVGDANERREWFCKVTGRTDARAANGGSRTATRCHPPEPTYIDWIMGGGRFEWRHYQVVRTATSDHPMHTAVLRWRG
jgi:endonuclease/exonuclease/phosphatase family metal-dependent hydrolase